MRARPHSLRARNAAPVIILLEIRDQAVGCPATDGILVVPEDVFSRVALVKMLFEKLPSHFIADNARTSRPHAFRPGHDHLQNTSAQHASAGGKRRACRREQGPPTPGPPHQVSIRGAPRLGSPPPARSRAQPALPRLPADHRSLAFRRSKVKVQCQNSCNLQ